MAKMTNSSVEIQIGVNVQGSPGTLAAGTCSPARRRPKSKRGGLRRSLTVYFFGGVLPKRKRMLKVGRALLPYGVALGAVMIALLLASLFAPQLRSTLSFLFFAAVTISAWYGGLGPSLLATALSILALDYFFTPPRYSLGTEEEIDAIRLVIFFIVAFLISTLYDRHQRAQATLRKLNAELEQRVAERTAALARSNAELEQFASVTSHDLQEPLRMVHSYVRLLAERYHGKLDAQADEFIGYALDGVTRMQQLIQDLLGYSRVGSRGAELRSTDCQAVLCTTLKLLHVAIIESGAAISYDPLPTVMADEKQLGQVLQNLLSNALKFRAPMAPRIDVSAQRTGREWRFAVRDNGIGIDPRQAERIFHIFQRLHTQSEYPGTGIGLAICKKIVERHGGRIWVESEPGKGATFFFTLPAQS
jgi:signal transduction histidine kinase